MITVSVMTFNDETVAVSADNIEFLEKETIRLAKEYWNFDFISFSDMRLYEFEENGEFSLDVFYSANQNEEMANIYS
jgi:hypothetical protein